MSDKDSFHQYELDLRVDKIAATRREMEKAKRFMQEFIEAIIHTQPMTPPTGKIFELKRKRNLE